jgi:deoxyadenosine/deoxycytidine kinase
MTELECSWEEFKQRIKFFRENVYTMNSDELDNSFKMLSLSYLNLFDSDEMWRTSAVILIRWASEDYHRRLFLLEETI